MCWGPEKLAMGMSVIAKEESTGPVLKFLHPCRKSVMFVGLPMVAHVFHQSTQHVGNMRYSALPGPSHHTPRRHHNWCTPSHCSSPAPTVRTPGMAKLGRSGRWLVEFEKHGFPCPSPSDKNPVVVEPLLIILAECLPACLISNGVV